MRRFGTSDPVAPQAQDAPDVEEGLRAAVLVERLLRALQGGGDTAAVAAVGAELRTCAEVDVTFVEAVLGPGDPVRKLLQEVRDVLIEPTEVVTGRPLT